MSSPHSDKRAPKSKKTKTHHPEIDQQIADQLGQTFDLWLEIKHIVDELEIDITKNARGSLEAGTRMRAVLLVLSKKVRNLRQFSIDLDKATRAQRTEQREIKRLHEELELEQFVESCKLDDDCNS